MPETSSAVKCSFCGNQLADDEAENPHLDSSGEPMCDECHHDKFEFTCCCCQNYGDVEDQHNLLVVFEEVGHVGPGIYKIKSKSYYTHAMIGRGWLHDGALKRIADVNPDMDGNGYPCGHLCLECQGRILAQFADRCRVCLNKSPSCLKVRLGSWKNVEANEYQWTKPKIVCASCRHSHKGSWRPAK